MSINSVALRGYGNGTINGTIAGVATRGYIIVISPASLGVISTITDTFGVKSAMADTLGGAATVTNTIGLESTV